MFERAACPACGQQSITPLEKGELAQGTTCDNPECQIVLNKESLVIGRWTEGYKEYVREPAHA